MPKTRSLPTPSLSSGTWFRPQMAKTRTKVAMASCTILRTVLGMEGPVVQVYDLQLQHVLDRLLQAVVLCAAAGQGDAVGRAGFLGHDEAALCNCHLDACRDLIFVFFALMGASPPASNKAENILKSTADRCFAVLPEQIFAQARQSLKRILPYCQEL